MKALCFGSMNIDYVYSLDHIVGLGETIFSTGRETFAGGKGLNQSVAMAKAGLPVWHAGICGTGGELLIDTLRENGVDTSLIRREDSPPGHTVIQVDARGQNCIIVYGGTNRRVTPEYIAEALSGFGEGDMVLLQNEVNRLGEIIDAADAGRGHHGGRRHVHGLLPRGLDDRPEHRGIAAARGEGGLDSGLAARRRPVHPLRRGARRRMKRGKRSVRSGMLIRLLAILYLPYLMFSMYRNYTSGETGVSLALFIALMAVMGIAEIAIAVSAVRLWLGHYKEEEKED